MICGFMGNDLAGDPPEMWNHVDEYPACKKEATFRHICELPSGYKFSTEYCDEHSAWRMKLNPLVVEALA